MVRMVSASVKPSLLEHVMSQIVLAQPKRLVNDMSLRVQGPC